MRNLLLLATGLSVVAVTACKKQEDVLEGAPAPSAVTAPPEAAPVAPPAPPAPPAAPPTPLPNGSGFAPAMAPGIANSGPGTGTARWTAPTTWTAQTPNTPMRVAQWALPAGPGLEAECAMFHFSGGGSVDGNVQRWIRQFEAPGAPADGSGAPPEAERAERTANGVKVTLVRTAGTYLSRTPSMLGPLVKKPNFAMFAAIFEVPGDPYFLKCVGSEPVLKEQEKAMVALVDSFTPGAP
jgi:hypothetical protein